MASSGSSQLWTECRTISVVNLSFQNYSDSRKASDALLKIGYCYYELKNWDAARDTLLRVQIDYPDTTAARLADQRLQRMEEEFSN